MENELTGQTPSDYLKTLNSFCSKNAEEIRFRINITVLHDWSEAYSRPNFSFKIVKRKRSPNLGIKDKETIGYKIISNKKEEANM